MAELCFNRCVNTLNYRTLTPDEEECVEKCAGKQVNINHKMMAIYMEVQPQIASRRAEEMNKLAQTEEKNKLASQSVEANNTDTKELSPVTDLAVEEPTSS